MKLISETPALELQSAPPVEPVFPSVRYFQIHFEHLHETIDDLRLQIQQANQQIAELQQQMEARTALARVNRENYVGERKSPPTDVG